LWFSVPINGVQLLCGGTFFLPGRTQVRKFLNSTEKFSSDANGSMAILFALILFVIAGSIGIALDYSRAMDERSKMQGALDAAVMAGAAAEDGQIAAAQAVFAANMSSDLAVTSLAAFSIGSSGEMIGSASAPVKNYFASLFGHGQFTPSVTAVASKPTGAPLCVILLDTAAPQALLLNGGANVQAPACEFHSKSTANPAAIFNSGTDITSSRICLAGTTIIDNGGTHPNLAKGCPAANNPFAGTLPVPASASCDYNNLNFNGSTATLSPGVYCGWVNFNASVNVTLQPGVYVIKGGGWNVNGGDWSGNGVTFYFADTSKIQFNSAVAANITAPTGGTYDGIVMYEADGLAKTQMAFDDSRDFNFKGLMYLPSRDVVFNSGSQAHSKEMGMVFNTLILNQTNWTLAPGGRAIPSGSGTGNVVLSN
jgi:Flp pilus assembly protein TadG